MGPTHSCSIPTRSTCSQTCFHMSQPLLLYFRRSHVVFLSFHLPPPCFLSISTHSTHSCSSSMRHPVLAWGRVDSLNAELLQTLPTPFPSLFPTLHLFILMINFHLPFSTALMACFSKSITTNFDYPSGLCFTSNPHGRNCENIL